MDRRLLRYYNRELQHLRESAVEFAGEFPKIAGRLGLDGFECNDPYVERLLEGFAFLAARVQLKLDAEFPRFTQHLLETVYPHYLAPTPSMAVVQFQPDLNEGALNAGFPVPRDSVLRSTLGKGEQTPCEYRTAHEVVLWPLELVQAQYYTREVAALGLPLSFEARAGIRLRLRATANLAFDKIAIDRLPLFLRGSDDLAMRLYEQIFAHARQVVVMPTSKPVKWHRPLAQPAIVQAGFTDAQALLPYTAPSFHGYRLLHEYFAFHQRFLFAELRGLQAAIAGAPERELDVVILLDQADLNLENNVSVENFALFCAPAINLFPKRADRIHVSDRFPEFHVVPDRTRPLDFEVYEVQGVTGVGSQAEQEQAFLPFYSATDFDDDDASAAYFALNRVPRQIGARERARGRRSSYAGSEVFISLVDARSAPYHADLRQLAVAVLCTNRDLPLHMAVGQGRTDFTLDAGAPVQAIRCVSGPTPPRPSNAEGEMAWRLISHLSLNYLSLIDNDHRQGAQALRDLLQLYGDASEPAIRKQVDGVKSVSSKAIVRRVATPGPITFARGLELTVNLDEVAFEGTGIFLLGAVLEQFFAKYVSINSFTETVVRSLDRGEVKRWPARLGLRHIL